MSKLILTVESESYFEIKNFEHYIRDVLAKYMPNITIKNIEIEE